MAQIAASPGHVPNITEADLIAFHTAHFSSTPVEHFSTHFLGPIEDEEEEGGLGYYPDGVKRTLTDEQIAMFRHSEIETLRRERRHAEEAREDESVSEEQPQRPDDTEDGEVDNIIPDSSLVGTEHPAPASTSQQPKASGKGKKGKRKNKKGGFNQNVKPDLRKRTWDKVEQGLGSLDYGEDDGHADSSGGAASWRRRITYNDV